MLRWIAAVALIAGCGDKDREADPAPTPTPTPADARPPRTAPPASFFGEAVAPPGMLAGLELGLDVDEAKAVRPAVFAKAGAGDPKYLLSYSVYHPGRRVEGLWVTFESGDPGALLAEAWGEGTRVIGENDFGDPIESVLWFDPKSRWRAHLEGRTLKLDRYLPIEQLLARATAIVGASHDQIVEQHGRDYHRIEGHEFESLDDKLSVKFGRRDVASTVHFMVSYGRYKRSAEAVRAYLWQAFVKAWGEPTAQKDVQRFRAGKVRIAVREDVKSRLWSVELSR